MGENLALTNSHCAYDEKTGTINNTVFYPNFQDGHRGIHTSAAATIASKRGSSDSDYALIKLGMPLGKRFGWLTLINYGKEFYSREGWKNNFVLPGYSHEYKNGNTAGVHFGCGFLFDVPGSGFQHDCDTHKGSSGAPILAWFDAKPYIVGLNWGGNKKTGLNYGVYSKTVYDAYQKIISTKQSRVDASVNLCNYRTDADVDFFLAYSNGTTWLGHGFLRVPPNKCTEIALKGIPPTAKTGLYAYAEKGRVSWSGQNSSPDKRASFCIQESDQGLFKDVHLTAANCPNNHKLFWKCGDYSESSVLSCWVN